MIKIILLVTLVFGIFVFDAEARVGGGDSYGGGRRSGGGSRGGWSSGSGSGYYSNNDSGIIFELIYWIIRIGIRYPLFGIPFLIFLAFILYSSYRKSHSYDDYYSKYESDNTNKEFNQTRDFVMSLTAIDPLFSYPLFKDFIFSLYSHFHENRGQKKLDLLSQYYSETIINKYNRHETLLQVDGVVVGNCQILSMKKTLEYLEVKVYFTANYTELYQDGKSQRFLLKESWNLRRGLQVKSKPPESITSLACPNCGASISETTSGKCFSCGQSNKNGKFDWFIYDINSNKEFYSQAANSSSLLSSVVIEEGTNLPTIKDPFIEKQLATVFKDRSELEYTHKRFKDIFFNLQKSWSDQNWELARPFESDSLFNSQLYWIEDFRRKKEKNYIEKIEVEKIVPVCIHSDNYYLSFTVRIFANMIDYTKNQSGTVIRGSSSKKISFTEYWTFIKGIGSNHKDAKIKNVKNCPSCGAELKISMAGKCDFCGTKITLGQFDWVLSQIEQDEEFNL